METTTTSMSQTHQAPALDQDYEHLIRQLVSNYQCMIDEISTKLYPIEQQWEKFLAS